MRTFMKYMVMIVIMAGLWGCGGGSSSTTPSGPTAAELTAEGWTAFEAADYDTALIKFDDALSEDNTYYEAYLGKGLVYITDAARYNESTAESNLAVIYNNRVSIGTDGRSTILIPAYVGMLGYKVKNNTNITFLKNVAGTLAFMSDGWVFSHNNADLALNWAMCRLNMAELYFYGSSLEADHTAAKTNLDRVRNYAGYSSLAQAVKDKASALYAQFTAAGLYD